jgi:hypothetical protein
MNGCALKHNFGYMLVGSLTRTLDQKRPLLAKKKFPQKLDSISKCAFLICCRFKKVIRVDTIDKFEKF